MNWKRFILPLAIVVYILAAFAAWLSTTTLARGSQQFHKSFHQHMQRWTPPAGGDIYYTPAEKHDRVIVRPPDAMSDRDRDPYYRMGPAYEAAPLGCTKTRELVTVPKQGGGQVTVLVTRC